MWRREEGFFESFQPIKDFYFCFVSDMYTHFFDIFAELI